MRMAEAGRNQCLPSGPSGYDEVFVDRVDEEFLCAICQQTLKEPILTRCGHRYCSECIEEHFRRQEQEGQPDCTCPVDREVLLRDKDVFPDKPTERKILSFYIKCDNNLEGCEWTGELRAKKDHLGSCLFEEILCTHENCQEKIKRKDLEAHVTRDCPWRIEKCFYCQEPHAHEQMEEHHKNCKRFIIHCDHCGKVVSREMLQDHIQNFCDKALIPCQYDEMGCKTKVPREELKSHLQSAIVSHVNLVQEELTRKLNGLEERENNLEGRNEERYGELQIEMNAVKGQLEKEVQGIQTLKEELQTLQAAAEAKDNAYAQQINNLKEEVNTIRNEKGKLMTELQNLQAASEAKDHDLKHLEEEVNNLSRHHEEKINTLQNEQNAYAQQINNLEEEVNTIRNEEGKLITELQNLRAASEAKDNELKHLKEEKNRIFEELSSAKWYTNMKILAMGIIAVFIFKCMK